MKVLLRPEKGEFVLYRAPGAEESQAELLVIEDSGLSIVSREWMVTSVQFLDGTWGLVRSLFLCESEWGKARPPFYAWVPDNEEAARGLRTARWVVSHYSGVGRYVYHVLIENWEYRRALIRLFYGKEKENGKKDELCWEGDKDMKKRLKHP